MADELPDAVFHPTATASSPPSSHAARGTRTRSTAARRPRSWPARSSATTPARPCAVARLTIELLRPVPLRPLEVRTRTVRPGKKVQLVEASVFADGTEVARATGAAHPRGRRRVRRRDPDDRLSSRARRLRERFENVGRLTSGPRWRSASARGAIERRRGRRRSGSGSRVPIVAGEETAPLMRVAAAADFGNGIADAPPELNRSRSLASRSSEVITMTGMSRQAVSFCNAATTAKPSISGIIKSSKIKSGLAACKLASACGPFSASWTIHC